MEQVIARIQKGQEQVQLILYADDCVLLHADRETLDRAANAITEWLKQIGLELKPSKTKTTHTLNPVEEQCELLRALAELEAKERTMYELENGKDQCMTVLKLALTSWD